MVSEVPCVGAGVGVFAKSADAGIFKAFYYRQLITVIFERIEYYFNKSSTVRRVGPRPVTIHIKFQPLQLIQLRSARRKILFSSHTQKSQSKMSRFTNGGFVSTPARSPRCQPPDNRRPSDLGAHKATTLCSQLPFVRNLYE